MSWLKNLWGVDVAVSIVDGAFMFDTLERNQPYIVPAFVAWETIKRPKAVVFGEKARSLEESLSPTITVKPILKEGRVVDYLSAATLIDHGLREVLPKPLFLKSKVLIGHQDEEPGMKLLRDAAIEGGAREVYLCELGMASALGLHLNVEERFPVSVFHMSEDWCSFHVLSQAQVLASVKKPIGTRVLIEDIQHHVTLRKGFRPEAVEVERALLSAGESGAHVFAQPWGALGNSNRSLDSVDRGVSEEDLHTGMIPSVMRVGECVRRVIRSLPKDQQRQVHAGPIHAVGSAMRISGLTSMLATYLGIAVHPTRDEIHPSIEGLKVVLGEQILHRKNFLTFAPSEGTPSVSD